MSKTVNKKMLKITILVVTFMQMATNGLSPAMSEIAAAFPEASASTVQMLMSLPGIFVVVLSFVSAELTARFSKKFLIGGGLVCLILVGVCGTLFHGSLQILFIWSVLMGLGMGLVIALTASLIADYFDGKEKEDLMGLQTSAGNVGGMIMTAVGGLLTSVAWNLDYCVYFLAVPGLILLLLFVPDGDEGKTAASAEGTGTAKTEEAGTGSARIAAEKTKAAETATAESGAVKTEDAGSRASETRTVETVDGKIQDKTEGKESSAAGQSEKDSSRGFLVRKKKVWMYFVFSAVVLFLFNAGPTNLSMYVSEFEIGGSVISGWAATVFLLGGTLMGIAFGAISRRIGVCTIPLGFLLVAVGFGVMIFRQNLVCLFAGSLIAGMCISLVSAQGLLQVSALAENPKESALASALIFAGANVGTFLTPQITNLAQAVTGSESTYYRFMLAIVLALVMAVITLFITLHERKVLKAEGLGK